MVPQKPRGESFKEDVITELNALTDQLRKRLKTDSAAWIALVTLMSMILVEWKGQNPDAVGSGEKGC